MKKLIAKFSVLALLAALVAAPNANAAGVAVTAALNGARTQLTVTLPGGVDLAINDDFTLKVSTTADGNPVDLSGAAQVTALTVDGNDEFAQVTNAGDANGYVAVTDLAANPAAGAAIVATLPALANDTAYTVMYRDSLGNYGAAMVNTGTSNQVTVTATVEPILTLALTNTAIALGTLNPAAVTNSATDTNVAVTTNATSGYVIQAGATNFVGAATAYQIGFEGSEVNTLGSDGFSIDAVANAITVGAGTLSVAAGFDDVGGNSVAIANGAQTIASADGTAGDGSIDVNYRANVSPVTPADNYSTTVTYTVTATY